MTPKQQRFVEEYLKDLNATRAYIRAGYSEVGARANSARMMAKDSIKQAIASRQLELQAETEITQEWVLENLKRNALRCMQEEQVLDREGKPIGEFTFQASPANRALELLGKHLGLFDDVVKHKADDSFADIFKGIASVGTSLPKPTNGAAKPNGTSPDH